MSRDNQNEIWLEAGKIPGVLLLRNNVGAYKKGKYFIQYGLLPGSGDLIGLKSVIVTPDMIGQKIGIFLSIETKNSKGKVSKKQLHWQKVINEYGGKALIINDPEKVKDLI